MGIEFFKLSSGTMLHAGSYRIIRFISSGGFGYTYEAEHMLLHKRMAIKEFFPKDFCNRDEATAHVTVGTQSNKALVNKLRKKFIDEAIAISQLQHPGIVHVTDVFEENGTAYYVMDYIDGMSLSDIVMKKGPMSEAEALGYIRQVCDALDYLHSNNRLHLDIKPANIMVGKDRRAILIDFGASKQYDEENWENTSTLMGKTPGYAPPEQMGNDVSKFSPATDIYALGATLYRVLSGVTPPYATLRISGEELAPLPNCVSVSTSNAVIRALDLNKKHRQQTIGEFLTMLSENDEDETIGEQLTLKPHPTPKPEPITKPKRTWIWYVIFAVIIIGLILFWLNYDDSHSSANANDIEVSVESLDTTSNDLAVVDSVPVAENEEFGAPLSEGDVEDGRGGFDDNASGYFSMHADTYLTSNRDIYFDGYFSDAKGKYPISLKFEIDDNWFPGICYYHNIDYNTKLKMTVRFTEEQMIITGNAGGCKFVMNFTPTIDGKWEGSAQNGNHRLKANIIPVKMP